MKSITMNLAAAVAVGTAGFAQSAVAAKVEAEIVQVAVVEEVGASERINLSGKLRMLSQRIPSAACHMAAGIETESATKLLAGASAEFDKIINGLEFGDDDLKIIGEEKRRKTLVKIKDLRDAWAPVKAASDAMLAGDTSDAQLNVILDQNLNVLGAAKLLVSELVGQYSDPTAMLQADSMVIDIAGRQRMLTQKMSKEACMLETAHAHADTAQTLQGTMQMFEASLMALRNGMPEAGIKAPPNDQITAGLDVVIANWNHVKPMLEEDVAGHEIDDAAKADAFRSLNETMANMNKVVGMYSEASKLGL